MSVGMKVAMQVALFLAQLCFCLIMWYAYTRILDGDLSFGQIYSFTVYAMNILAGFSGAGLGVGGVFAALGALGRIHEIWSREPAVPISNGLRPDGLEMKVKFNDVSFSYPSRPETLVLQGVSLEVPVGTSAAFVGSSGCGKSTMLQLISRFYDVHSGVVSLGDFDIRELDASWLRRRIGVVQQEPVLFGFNVHSNIAYGRNAMHLIEGKPLPTQEEIEHAAELANVHGFVSELPDKYETLVGERGVLLSGGQKQRVAIARALLMDPKMLLLDEATSALDSASEHHVQDAIDNASRGRTVIVVAHRLSTVRDADQIFVMDGGRIVDVGKHEVLLEKCERYRELVFRQDSAEKCRGEANASEISGEVGEAHL
jgi:ABC-type multidrug transport system fused ATPase/permease subunit